MTDFILSRNYFLFDDDHYLQVYGTNMGNLSAPHFASLYVGFWEESLIMNSEENHFPTVIFNYLFTIFKGTELQLREFHQLLNEKVDN